MKILHVIESLNLHSGGPPMIATRLAAAQASLGHQVRLAAHDTPGAADQIDAALRPIPHFQSVDLILIPRRPSWQELLGRGAAQMRSLVEDAQVVHLHFSWESLILVTGRLCRRMGRPYVVMLNGMLDPWSLAQSPWKKKAAMAAGHARMLRGAAALHLGNRQEQRLIEPLRLGTAQAIIPNGVFVEEIEALPDAGCFHAAHPQLQMRPFILFMSRIHHKKGPDLLLEAFAAIADEFPTMQLVVAGPDGGAVADVHRRAADARLSERVHVVGPIYGQQKLAALVDCRLFCLPSRQEGFSMAITEALGCGTPVVITEGCHFPEVAEAGAGEVVATDSGAVAEALRRMLRDDALRQRMSQAARRLARERYTWPKIAEQTLAVYREALGRGSC